MKKYIKRDDTKPFVRVELAETKEGPPSYVQAVDLTGATIKFIMKDLATGTVKVEATLAGSELVDLSNGLVQYEWETEDTDTVGEYQAEFEVTDTSGYIMTFSDMRSSDDVDNNRRPEPLIICIYEDLA